MDRIVYTIRKVNDAEIKIDVDNSSNRKLRTLEDVLNDIGMGFFQYRLLAICGLAFMADSMEISLLGYISTCAGISFDLDNNKKASIAGVVFFGQLFGSLIWGRLGDRYGRRTAYLASSAMVSLFGFITGLSPNFISLLIFRMMVGIGIGGSIIPFDIIAEFMPLSYRGQFLVSIEYFWTFGSMIVAGLAWGLLSSTSWRVLAVLTAVPVTISLLLGAWCLPESVRWLVSRKKTEQAEKILSSIAALNGVSIGSQ
jgi:putative MFS transporter